MGTIRYAACAIAAYAVHPHGRGDNEMRIRQIGTLVGSPPRAWGQFIVLQPVAGDVRFTPTGVGTIAVKNSCSRSVAVHPHGRGDNFLRDQTDPTIDGSPPRAWGQLSGASLRRQRCRFTPTGVGTIASARASSTRAAVHPHGRGDNVIVMDIRSFLLGSPPRAWGQSYIDIREPGSRRFTPTGVGTMHSGS